VRIEYDPPSSSGKEFIELAPDITAAILFTLVAGWEAAVRLPDVNASAGEVAITERLRDGMREALKSRGFAWKRNMVVLPGTESRSRPTVLLPDGRTDIPIFLIEIFLGSQDHDPHAVIECKRIAVGDRTLCREYVVQGVDRFRLGKYGENHAIGFMVGYLLSGNAAGAVTNVNAYLTSNGRGPEHLQPVPEPPPTWSSQHARHPTSVPITLFHSFFTLQTG
jgi:hypothetical protein